MKKGAIIKKLSGTGVEESESERGRSERRERRLTEPGNLSERKRTFEKSFLKKVLDKVKTV